MAVPDPIASGVQGAVQALVADATNGVKRFLKLIESKQLGCSADPDVIELVKTERKAPEFSLLKQYLLSRDLRIQVQLGLALRKAEGTKHLESLRGSLQGRFGTTGLHVAELTANGVVTEYLNLLIREEESSADINTRFESFLQSVDQYTMWIRTESGVERTIEKIRARLDAVAHGTVALLAKGRARTPLNRIVEGLRKSEENYLVRTLSYDSETIVFISQQQIWGALDDSKLPKTLLKAATERKRGKPG
jgi:hypothetical protein